MKILILGPGLPQNINNIKGGVHSAVINLLYGFLSKNIDIRVISFTKEVKKKTIVKFSERIEIIHEPEGPFSFHSINYLLNGTFILKRNIKEFNPDLIHYQTGNTLMFTKLLGTCRVKTIHTIHAFAFEEMKTKSTVKDKLTFWYNGVVNNLLPINNIIYISDSSKQSHINIKIKNSIVIPNALRPDYFNLLTKRKTTNRILYIGVINNRKNLLFLLKTINQLFSENINYSLDVLGDFTDVEYKNVINDFLKANEISNNIKFHGWVNQSESLKFIAETDIVAITSFQETLPMVIAESMAAGKVVISSDVGGIPEMINNSVDGFLFNFLNPKLFHDILHKLYNNHDFIFEIGSKAKDRAISTYHCDNVASKTISFYRKCLENKN